MKPKMSVLLITLVLCIVSLQGLFIAHAQADHGRRSRHSYYRHHRYYPRDYFYYRKLYHYPLKRYYFYYDIYPQKRYYYDTEKYVYQDNPEYLPITSIANMASQGVPDDVIISEIKRTRSSYKLTSEIITYLRQNGVSDRVIDAMLGSGKAGY